MVNSFGISLDITVLYFVRYYFLQEKTKIIHEKILKATTLH